MKRKSRAPKGSRGGSRGGRGGRGRARGGGSRNSTGARSEKSVSSGATRGGRGVSRAGQSTSTNKVNGILPSHPSSSTSRSGSFSASSDVYLHKKFKKPTNTVVDDLGPKPISSPSPPLETTSAKDAQLNGNIMTSNTSVTSTLANNQATTNGNQLGFNSGSVYKPKFRITTSDPDKCPTSLNSSTSCSNGDNDSVVSTLTGTTAASSSGDETNAGVGKISKLMRLDRQSIDAIDNRISKLIDENKTILEWPELFTKKLKGSRNPQSQNTAINSSKPNQYAMMSGGSTTEINPSIPGSTQRVLPSNGFLKHDSFEIGTVPGSVQLLTNPLILKAQSDKLGSNFNQMLQNTPPAISEVNFSLPPSNSMVVPKKRRRLSPTPSRLCGGEVSELPASDVSLSKSYYQDIDVNVRVNNCSGAKVTIRTSGANNSMNYVRFAEPVPSSLSLESPTVFMSTSQQFDSDFCLEDKERPNLDSKASQTFPKSPKRKAKCLRLSSETEDAPSVTAVKVEKTSETAKWPTTEVPTKCTSPSVSATSNSKVSASFQVIPNSPSNPKRPNFLALKPVNNTLKKSEPGVLPSPETPRVAKSYNQMSINGNAYTYLGFKVSTRSSYTTLFKPQPMFVPQQADAKLSMYSNWQPCPKDPKEPELSMSTNDSRVNGRKDLKTLYTSAVGKNCDTMTVSSPDKQPPITSPVSDRSPLAILTNEASDSASSSTKVVSSSTSTTSTITQSVLKFGAAKKQTAAHLDDSLKLVSSAGVGIPLLRISPKMETKAPKTDAPVLHPSISGDNIAASCINKDNMKHKRDEMESSAAKSLGVVGNKAADTPRIKIMEGGFESNEDYTYVRGRGRGRYVCEACGIRCKKPSMLRKHLKTHTDLRPYTCKLCNFSFKTKGNLTKHQKSKSHHKKCVSMGIDPQSPQSLATLGPTITDSNSENESEDDDEDETQDSDSQDATSSTGNEHDTDSVEKEIAQSLLDLSKTTPVNGVIDCSKREKSHNSFSISSMLGSEVPENRNVYTIPEIPIDLSVKTKPQSVSPKRPKDTNGLVRPVGIVSEAQRWEPEEELIKGTLNLTKVLNNNNNNNNISSSPPTLQTGATPHKPSDVFSREIKQEQDVPEVPSETARSLNGFPDHIIRKRQDSEASCSSVASGGCVEVRPETSASCNGSSTTPAVKLHQPWLSPPDKPNAKETVAMDTKSASPSALIQTFDMPADVGGKIEVHAPCSQLEFVPTSPNSKAGSKPKAEFRQPSGAQAFVKEDGKAECNVCGKKFARASQLTLHMNIHYLERPFKCEPCGVSFRTKGHLIKHRRSSNHDCKVYLTETWGVANEENPRPFKCPDCKIAFRIHGHLAKHLRSKMHIMRMECLGKLPLGIYFEMEKTGMNLNEIDTTDCDMSLISLQNVASKIYGDNWADRLEKAVAPLEETP